MKLTHAYIAVLIPSVTMSFKYDFKLSTQSLVAVQQMAGDARYYCQGCPWKPQTGNMLALLFFLNNNNNNSYIALYPIKIYKLAALYIININMTIKITFFFSPQDELIAGLKFLKPHLSTSGCQN